MRQSTTMIRTMLILGSIIFFSTLGSSQFNIGAGLTYIERGNEIGLQAKAFYGWNDSWGAAATFDYILTDGTDFDINGDIHYRFNIGRDARIHPLAGLNLAKFNADSTLDIGINLGVFAAMPIQDRLKLYLEPKVIIGGQSSFAISMGVMI